MWWKSFAKSCYYPNFIEYFRIGPKFGFDVIGIFFPEYEFPVNANEWTKKGTAENSQQKYQYINARWATRQTKKVLCTGVNCKLIAFSVGRHLKVWSHSELKCRVNHLIVTFECSFSLVHLVFRFFIKDINEGTGVTNLLVFIFKFTSVNTIAVNLKWSTFLN